MLWRNGRLIRDNPRCVPPAALEGVMTTIGCDGGWPLLWDRHRRRLLEASVPAGRLPEIADLEVLLEKIRCPGPARVRIAAWQDAAPAGWAVEAVAQPIESWGPDQRPLVLGIVRWDDPPPPGVKVLARHRWQEAGDRARAWGADDALMVDGEGRLLETSIANVFVRRALIVATPPSPDRCLGGTMRAVLIDRLPRIGLQVEERDLFQDELVFADEVWISNAVVGAVRVARAGPARWDQWPFFERLSLEGLPAPGWARP